MLVLRVSDTGQGMTQEQIHKIFDEYARFNLEANRSTMGFGLGMTITRNLINIMGGDISIESELGKGSVFTVRIPQNKNGSGPMGKELAENLMKLRYTKVTQAKKQKIARENMSYGKVLVVDDMPQNIDVATILLKPYGLKIDTAESGFEAIDRIKSGNVYDIVFMDHMMPDMDGMEAVKIIRELGYKHPIIALTANAMVGQADIFLANGFDEFIPKPIDIRELNSSLNRFIRDKQSHEVLEAARKKTGIHAEGTPQITKSGVDIKKKSEKFSEENFKNMEILGLNIQGVFDSYYGEWDLYLSALQSFIENTPKIIETMRDVTEENLREYIVKMHGLKGVISSIGADEIQVRVEALEQMTKVGDMASVLAQNDGLLNDVEKLVENIRKWISKQI
jgi:CheY-like chemotaxis protein/HPt (histidine-containing phosphotransfer) domain-containing protein